MLQKVILIGNLGRDPEIRYTANEQAVCNISVACTRQYNNSQGERVKETLWARVACWGKLAETVSKYLHKGSKVYIEGRLSHDENGNPRTFTRQDGTTGASFEVVAENVKFLDPAPSDNGNAAPEPEEEEIPF